jgi:hypothetical protein
MNIGNINKHSKITLGNSVRYPLNNSVLDNTIYNSISDSLRLSVYNSVYNSVNNSIYLSIYNTLWIWQILIHTAKYI